MLITPTIALLILISSIYWGWRLVRLTLTTKEDKSEAYYKMLVQKGVDLSEDLLQSRHAPMSESLQLNREFDAWEKRVYHVTDILLHKR